MGKLIKSNASLTADMEEIHNKTIRFETETNQYFKIASYSAKHNEDIIQSFCATLRITCDKSGYEHKTGTITIWGQYSEEVGELYNEACGIDILEDNSFNSTDFYLEKKNAETEEIDNEGYPIWKTELNIYFKIKEYSSCVIDIIANDNLTIKVEPVTSMNGGEGFTGKYAKVTTNLYSTTEKIIGTWIDDKPIYRQTLVGTAGTSGTTDLGRIYNIEQVISITGAIEYENGWHQIGAYANANFYSLIQIQKGGTVQIWHKADGGYKEKKAVVVIEYTKK